jgi:hypothetical protein
MDYSFDILLDIGLKEVSEKPLKPAINILLDFHRASRRFPGKVHSDRPIKGRIPPDTYSRAIFARPSRITEPNTCRGDPRFLR